MRKGDVPITHIVAIILGVAVIGLIGYWLFTSYFKGKTGGETAECLGYKIANCTGIPIPDRERVEKLCGPLPLKGSDECKKLLEKE